MKAALWISLILFALGVFGIFGNIFTGLSLTNNDVSGSDYHLILALSSVGLLILGSLGQILSSQRSLGALQESILLSSQKSPAGLQKVSNARTQAVSFSIFVVVCCVINLISGTISQTGRFPLIHGVFGFALAGLSVATLFYWIQFHIRLFGFEK